MQQIIKMQEASIDTKSLTPDMLAKQTRVMKVVREQIALATNWDTIKPMFITIYAQTFTPDEIKGMTTFFKSPVGQSWINKQPEVQAATMEKMQTIMAEAQPKIQAAIRKAMESDTTFTPTQLSQP